MAKERNRLKDVVVKRLLSRKQPGMHPDGAGLYLRIRDGGGASWTFRYKLHGKDRWLDIGDPRDTSLAEARKLARPERTKVDAGRDPIAERREADALARRRGTFAERAEEWYAAEVEHRLKHPEAVRCALDKHLIKKLGRTPVAAFVAAKDAGGKEESRTRALSRVEPGKLFAAIRNEQTFGGDNLLLVWHLPAKRSKTSAAQDIPLSPAVVAWLRTEKELAAGSDWVFPARRRDKRGKYKHVGMDTLNVALGRVKHGLDPFTIHDFRRTARTQLAELGVEGIYNRRSYFAERRAALQTWADLLVQIEASKSNVVPIRGKQVAKH